jgi:lipocalin
VHQTVPEMPIAIWEWKKILYSGVWYCRMLHGASLSMKNFMKHYVSRKNKTIKVIESAPSKEHKFHGRYRDCNYVSN